jgi:hypothetical protein
MSTLVHVLHVVTTPIFEVITWPFRSLAPVWALTAISAGAGIFLVWLFGKTSDQEQIKAVRDRIRGNLIGVRLFQHDIGVVLGLQRRIFADTFGFMRLALVPLLVMLVPVVLIMTQLALRFDVRPLSPGESVVLKAIVRDASLLDQPLSLEVPEGVTVETPPVRVLTNPEVAWRVRVDTAGDHVLRVHIGDEALEKELSGGGGWRSIGQLRTTNPLDALLYPGEPPIDAGHQIETIEVAYPPLEMSLLGFGFNWLIGFFVLSMFFGFAFKGVLGVEV